MAKRLDPEREAQNAAIKAAYAKPEKHFRVGWKSAHLFAGSFGLWTNWNEWSCGFGEPAKKYHGDQVPENKWTFFFRFWKPCLVVHKHTTLLVCRGWGECVVW